MSVKYIITVKNEREEWEEEINSIYVDEESCFYRTHEVGFHEIPRQMTQMEFEQHAKRIIRYYNDTLKRYEVPRFFVNCRIETA